MALQFEAASPHAPSDRLGFDTRCVVLDFVGVPSAAACAVALCGHRGWLEAIDQHDGYRICFQQRFPITYRAHCAAEAAADNGEPWYIPWRRELCSALSLHANTRWTTEPEPLNTSALWRLTQPVRTTMTGLWRSVRSAITSKYESRGVVIGLDAAGKTTMLWALRSPDRIQYPTIGCSGVECIDFPSRHGTHFVCWDIGTQFKIRPLLRHYFEGLHVMVVVIDSTDIVGSKDRLQEELEWLLTEDALRGVAWLFLANKQDLPWPRKLSVEQVVVELGLEALMARSRCSVWAIQPVSAMSREGLVESFMWADSMAKVVVTATATATVPLRPVHFELLRNK